MRSQDESLLNANQDNMKKPGWKSYRAFFLYGLRNFNKLIIVVAGKFPGGV